MPRTTLLRKQVTPTGTIQPHAGALAPDGFLVCDGTIVTIADYPKLFATIGTSWGYGNNDGLTFHLPDLRGRMLRGCDSGAGRDPDVGSRTAANTGGNTGDNVGSVQSDATKKGSLTASTSNSVSSQTANHTHYTQHGTQQNNIGLNTTYPETNGCPGVYGGRYTIGTANVSPSNGNLSNHQHTVSSTTTVTGGDLETRPINANVNYVIKAV